MKPVRVFTDKVAEFQNKYPGVEVEPVDVYGNFVPLEKDASDNLSNTEESIQNNFNLEDCGPIDLPTKTAQQAEEEGGEY